VFGLVEYTFNNEAQVVLFFASAGIMVKLIKNGDGHIV